jgi:hypothetical protein
MMLRRSALPASITARTIPLHAQPEPILLIAPKYGS